MLRLDAIEDVISTAVLSWYNFNFQVGTSATSKCRYRMRIIRWVLKFTLKVRTFKCFSCTYSKPELDTFWAAVTPHCFKCPQSSFVCSSTTCFNFTINWMAARPVERSAVGWPCMVSNFIYKLYLDVATGVCILIARFPLCSCYVEQCSFWLLPPSFQVS